MRALKQENLEKGREVLICHLCGFSYFILFLYPPHLSFLLINISDSKSGKIKLNCLDSEFQYMVPIVIGIS